MKNMRFPTPATHQAAKVGKNGLENEGPFGKPKNPQKHPFLTLFLTRIGPSEIFFRGSHWENPKNDGLRINLEKGKNRTFGA